MTSQLRGIMDAFRQGCGITGFCVGGVHTNPVLVKVAVACGLIPTDCRSHGLRKLTIVERIVLRYCRSLDPNAELETIIADIMRRKVFGPSMRDEMTQLLPQLVLSMSQRPRAR